MSRQYLRTILAEISCDLHRFDAPPLQTLIAEPQHRWLAAYRIVDSCRWKILRAALGQALKRYGRKFGYTIPLGTLGSGLRLPHAGTIVVSGGARVGSNCQIYQGVTLGASERGAPVIGDNVFIGPNVTVVGPVIVGDKVTLVAGVAVRFDVPSGAVVFPPSMQIR